MADEIIGFDFGHGETAVCRLDTSSRAELMPDPLRLGDSQSKAGPIMTAVAQIEWDGEARTLVGQDAVATPNATDVRIAFKGPNVTADDTLVPLQRFIGRVVQYLVEERVIHDPPTAKFVFGAPSGWSKQSYSEFRNVLSDIVPSSEIEVVPESRAAFAYAAHAKDIDFESEMTAKSILLVDLGSSTVDITTVDALAEAAIDVGEPLGAGLLEKAILDHMLAAETNGPVREIIERDSAQLARCEAECRKAKEEYYDAISANGTLLAPIVRPRQIPGGGFFIVELDQPTMGLVESAPVESLGGVSWFERLEHVLRNAREIVAARRSTPEIVLLTGGAARMPRALEVAIAVFGADAVRRGTEPGLAIARGLAIVGNIDRRVSAFQADVDRFVRDVLPDLVKAHTESFSAHIASAVTDGLTERLVIPEIRKWIANEHRTLKDASSAIDQQLTTWLATAECERRLGEATVDWFNEVSRDVRKQTDPICKKHGMPMGTLAPPTITFDEGVKLGGMPLDVLDGEAVDTFILGTSAVVGTVVAMIAFGGGTALIASTGVGLAVLAGVAVFVGLVVGMDNAKGRTQEWAESANIWPFVRRSFGGALESKILASSEKIESEARTAIATALTDQSDAAAGKAQLISNTIHAVETHLTAVANRVAILIT